MKPRASVVALIVCLASLSGQAALGGPTITLTGTIRDFSDSHPDFEDGLGDDRGIVLPDLGLDGKPVYAGQAGHPTTTGQTNFDQWYRNVPGINLPGSYSIQLTEDVASPGTYSYCNNAFFPIDNQLLGNEGRGSNYHFTYEIHTTFGYNGGEVFTFSGDDDLWVFLNGKLAIDLGGVHPQETETISLDALAGTLGITTGNTYSFDLFFAERHTSASNFCIETSIQLEPVATRSTTWSAIKAWR